MFFACGSIHPRCRISGCVCASHWQNASAVPAHAERRVVCCHEESRLLEELYTVVDLGGARYRGIANYGTRPTFGDARTVLEVYVDGYAGDLYGHELTVCFDGWIRGIRKFSSAEELSAQLQRDLEAIR